MYEHPSEQTAIHTVFLLRVLLHNPGFVSKGGITLRYGLRCWPLGERSCWAGHEDG
jgi:hypothetical protein